MMVCWYQNGKRVFFPLIPGKLVSFTWKALGGHGVTLGVKTALLSARCKEKICRLVHGFLILNPCIKPFVAFLNCTISVIAPPKHANNYLISFAHTQTAGEIHFIEKLFACKTANNV